MARRSSGLGRGLDAIFLENTLDNSSEKENSINTIKISLIDPKSDQPRKYFDKESLEELSESIKENGLLQPILVREYGEGGRYQIIAGERRFRASRLAGLTEIPAIVLDRDDRAVAQIALIENIQREDLNPLEEALAYKSLKEEYGMTQEELSEKIGKSRSAIANSMRLLELPDPILTMVAARELSAGHARTLLGVKDREDMILLAQITAEQDLSVRQLEEQVKKINKKKKPEVVDIDDEDDVPFVDYFREMELRIQRQLGRKVKIEDKGKKKTLTLYYEDNEDLDELLKSICGKDFLDEF